MSSPVVLVFKKDNSWCFRIGHRKLSKKSKKDTYPLPTVHGALDSLHDAQYFPLINMSADYWQIDVDRKYGRKLHLWHQIGCTSCRSGRLVYVMLLPLSSLWSTTFWESWSGHHVYVISTMLSYLEILLQITTTIFIAFWNAFTRQDCFLIQRHVTSVAPKWPFWVTLWTHPGSVESAWSCHDQSSCWFCSTTFTKTRSKLSMPIFMFSTICSRVRI